MKSLLFLLPLLQIAWSSPHLRLTAEEFKALQVALNGRKPVLLTSALPVLSLKSIPNNNKFFLVGIGGTKLHGKAYGYRKKGISSGKFLLKPHKVFRSKGNQRYRPVAFRYSPRKTLEELLSPIYRDEVANIKPLSKRPEESGLITRQNNSVRRKRQTYGSEEEEEEEEEPLIYREELSFGLSTAGGVLGGAVGGYLDTTGTATLKLIRSLENIGLLAVGQVDNFLDQQDEKREREERRRAKSSYKPPSSYSN